MLRITKSASTETLVAYRFIQRCSSSGTAKGKQPKSKNDLKRSKISTKKGSPPGDSAVPKARPQEDAKLRLYDQCLKAPTPVRFLKPKERAREAEREKLGLISKERQREIDIQKQGGKAAMGVPEEPMIIGTPGLDLITLGLVDAEMIPKYNFTAEDGMRLAKEYSRILMRQHRARQAAETGLLNLKKEAIAALPDKLKEAALIPDLTPFPINRFMATLTPPIEGYIDDIKEAAGRNRGQQKRR